jgi:hypothetical protein
MRPLQFSLIEILPVSNVYIIYTYMRYLLESQRVNFIIKFLPFLHRFFFFADSLVV